MTEPRDLAAEYLGQTGALLAKIDAREIADLAAAIWRLWQNDGTLLICGNGGSASTASHMACDLQKQTRIPGRRPLRALALTDNVELITAWSNDAGFATAFSEQVTTFGRPGDALLCISCTGTSANVVAAAAAARDQGMAVYGLAGFDGGAIRELSEICVLVPDSDYGAIESAHLVVEHCLTTLLKEMASGSVAGDGDSSRHGPVVVIDRDGVLNRNRDDYVKSWAEFEFLPGAVEAVVALTRAGHRVVVITNQSAVGRGLMSPAQLTDLHRRMTEEILTAGGRVDGIYVCPHRPEEACDCRKPAPGLISQAQRDYGFDPTETWVVGDHHTDVEAAHSAGCMAMLVRTGRHAEGDSSPTGQPDQVVEDLSAAARLLIAARV